LTSQYGNNFPIQFSIPGNTEENATQGTIIQGGNVTEGNVSTKSAPGKMENAVKLSQNPATQHIQQKLDLHLPPPTPGTQGARNNHDNASGENNTIFVPVTLDASNNHHNASGENNNDFRKRKEYEVVA
jgi:hypothetical protein